MSRALLDKLRERFAASFAVAGDGCWLWTARLGRSARYGAVYFRHEGRQRCMSAHRLAWLLYLGDVPEGLHVLHRCDAPLCVNPGHLFLGTHAENMADKVAKKRHRFGVRSGEASQKAKLTEASVGRIRALIALKVPRRAIAEQFGVSKSAINWIARGRTWASGSRIEVFDAR